MATVPASHFLVSRRRDPDLPNYRQFQSRESKSLLTPGLSSFNYIGDRIYLRVDGHYFCVVQNRYPGIVELLKQRCGFQNICHNDSSVWLRAAPWYSRPFRHS